MNLIESYLSTRCRISKDSSYFKEISSYLLKEGYEVNLIESIGMIDGFTLFNGEDFCLCSLDNDGYINLFINRDISSAYKMVIKVNPKLQMICINKIFYNKNHEIANIVVNFDLRFCSLYTKSNGLNIDFSSIDELKSYISEENVIISFVTKFIKDNVVFELSDKVLK